jgi:hypothetical protein
MLCSKRIFYKNFNQNTWHWWGMDQHDITTASQQGLSSPWVLMLSSLTQSILNWIPKKNKFKGLHRAQHDSTMKSSASVNTEKPLLTCCGYIMLIHPPSMPCVLIEIFIKNSFEVQNFNHLFKKTYLSKITVFLQFMFFINFFYVVTGISIGS